MNKINEKMKTPSVALLLLSIIAMTGCQSLPPEQSSELHPVQAKTDTSGQTSVIGDEASYTLGPGDRIKVAVYGQDDLSGEFEIDGSGSLSLPLINKVTAAGLSSTTLEEAIANKLKPKYLKNPSVTVEVMNYRPFYILGEVNRPGSYPYQNGMTVERAVAEAGGYTYRAKRSKVIIKRSNDEEGEIRAQPESMILPGDVIEIPERFF